MFTEGTELRVDDAFCCGLNVSCTGVTKDENKCISTRTRNILRVISKALLMVSINSTVGHCFLSPRKFKKKKEKEY